MLLEGRRVVSCAAGAVGRDWRALGGCGQGGGHALCLDLRGYTG